MIAIRVATHSHWKNLNCRQMAASEAFDLIIQYSNPTSQVSVNLIDSIAYLDFQKYPHESRLFQYLDGCLCSVQFLLARGVKATSKFLLTRTLWSNVASRDKPMRPQSIMTMLLAVVSSLSLILILHMYDYYPWSVGTSPADFKKHSLPDHTLPDKSTNQVQIVKIAMHFGVYWRMPRVDECVWYS